MKKRCLIWQSDGNPNIIYLGQVNDNYQLPIDTMNGYFYLGYVLNYEVYDITQYQITCDNFAKETTFVHTGNSREFAQSEI